MIEQNKNSLPFQFGELITLNIHGLGNSGEGVGYYQGYTVFVEGALPTEQVKVRIEECKKTYGRGKLIKILVPSPFRVDPICPLFSRCGGCQLMHFDYQAQLKIKQQKVIDAFERIGKLQNVFVANCLPSPNPLAYRNKIQLPVKNVKNKLVLGLYAKGSHDLIEVDHCFIHCKIGQEIYEKIKKILEQSSIQAFDEASKTDGLRHVLIKSSVNLEEAMVILVSNKEDSSFLIPIAKEILNSNPLIKGVIHNINRKGGNVILGDRYQLLAGSNRIKEKLGHLYFEISPASFFQVNTAQAENVYNKALEYSELKGDETVLDAYCGVGTLSLYFADKVKKIIGIECVPEAIENAKENAILNNMKNTEFFCAKAEEFIQKLKNIDLVLLNPPRKGCEVTLLQSLATLQPKKIIYISCDPATLSRDLAYLHSIGYIIQEAQPYDMFPQTAHVETVVKLQKI